MTRLLPRKTDAPAVRKRAGRKPGQLTQGPPPLFAKRQPGQRTLDHGAQNRIAEWRAYQATWQKPIDEIEFNAERFYNLRRNILGLNRKQTARILRAHTNSILNWENGTHPPPFYAYLALLLISQSLHYRLAHDSWKDWEIVERFNSDSRAPAAERKHVAALVNRTTGAHFSPGDLDRYNEAMNKLAQLEADNFALRAENLELRERSSSAYQEEQAARRQNALQAATELLKSITETP